MDINEYYSRLVPIIEDGEKTTDQRIIEAFNLKDELKPDDEVEAARFNALTYNALTAMLDKVNGDHEHDEEMLQLQTLAAEAAIDGKLERTLKGFSRNVDELIDSGAVPYDTVETASVRIVESLKQTVYNHDRYKVLDAFIRRSYREAKQGTEVDREEVAEMARAYWRLDHLLSIHGALDEAVETFIPIEEMREIRNNPREGMLKKDPIEYTRRWEDAYYDVVEELDQKYADTPRHMGFCFEYWHAMEELLARKYRILWRNPHLMNPGVIFD